MNDDTSENLDAVELSLIVAVCFHCAENVNGDIICGLVFQGEEQGLIVRSNRSHIVHSPLLLVEGAKHLDCQLDLVTDLTDEST